jgi:hypothetical protein
MSGECKVDEVIEEIMGEVFDEAFAKIANRYFKRRCVHLYKTLADGALAEILYIWHMPQPCCDFSCVINGWRHDKAANTTPRDSLVTPKLTLQHNFS